jgi:hypothetical protein
VRRPKKGSDRIKRLVDDLTSLEINTIRRAEMTGESMPDPRHALYDIATQYNTALNGLLAGDERRTTGGNPKSVVAVRFTQAAYRRGEAAMLAVTVQDGRGSPRSNQHVRAMIRSGPHMVAMEPASKDPDAARARMQAGQRDPGTLIEAKTDSHGGAFLLMSVPQDAHAGACVSLEVADVSIEIEIPLTQIRGDLATFHYLNKRANEAPDRSHWLVRRIELHSIRLASLLQSIPHPDGKGCDANDHSRRALNGVAESGDDAPAKPKPLRLAAPELVLIRKIWELGCEQIVMQTVVQLDGDVVTRLSADIESDQHQLIHRLHADGVRVATHSWQFLVETLVGFAKSFLGWFTR